MSNRDANELLDSARQLFFDDQEKCTARDLRLVTALAESAPVAIYHANDTGSITYANPEYRRIFDLSPEQNIDEWAAGVHPHDRARMKESWAAFCAQPMPTKFEYRTESPARGLRYFLEQVVAVSAGGVTGFVGAITDLTRQKNLEAELAQGRRLQAMGQLAAGIAHEINTPTQFIGDNVRFLDESFGDILTLTSELSNLVANAANGEVPAASIAAALDGPGISFLREEIPKAIAQTLEGIERISKLVLAMKEFSHPGLEKTLVDLNRAIAATITVATSEWKYVAGISMDFHPALPLVPVMPGSFNQVVLNLIVNAAHAMTAPVGEGTQDKGTITVSTSHADGWVEIRISDTGCGMPAAVRDRIFEPFFTTKPIGKGTGQGLSIAHDVVVNKHGGTIAVHSELDVGTTFIIRLPLEVPFVASTNPG